MVQFFNGLNKRVQKISKILLRALMLIRSKVSMLVETGVLLSKGMVDSRKVKVDFSLEDMDLSAFKGKATYEQIKAYILEHTGLKVSSLYIAQIKKISSIVC